RNTHGYVAYDCQKKCLVYLKDSWRVVHDDIKKEGDVLQTLNENKVPYVPTLAYHGDLGQATLSQDLWRRYHPDVGPDARCPLKKHEHYRLVVEEIGKPLTDFESSKQLVFAMATALKAHETAYKLGILHRDVSAGNILLTHNPAMGIYVGMLNDWELAKNVTKTVPAARQPDRTVRSTGTWQFLSVSALNNCEKPIDLQDDLESFFHVLLYIAIRFLPH
ncbi:kinase-like domain-containing protein, partial [Trametes polyzona]